MTSPLKKSFSAELLRKRQKKRPTLFVVTVIVALIAVGYALYIRFGIREIPVTEEITSIAVLPLKNFSGDPEQVYFTDGMHEALISSLSKIGALRVISSTSVMGYRETEKKVPEIARELNVDAVVEGSVFRTDNQVRITVQLIGAVPERHLWANDYARDLYDIIALQNEVAQAIASEIKIMVTPEEKEHLSSARAVNPEAYDSYLMGRHFSREFPSAKSFDYYLQAVDKDSSFAAAYAEIAFLWAFAGRSWGVAPLKAYTEAITALERALELDHTLPGVYVAQGLISMCYDMDWRTAEDNFKKAIEIDPNYMTTYVEIDNLLTLLGREQEALELQKKALEIDPFALGIMADNMSMLGYLGDYEEAEQLYQKMVEIDSTWWGSYYNVGLIHAAQGKYKEAIAAFTKQRQVTGYSGPNSRIGYVYGLMGKRAEAEKILAEFQGNVRQENWIRLGLKDFDPIFETLENLYNERSPMLIYHLLECKRWSKYIVSDPRWKALMKKMGLPE